MWTRLARAVRASPFATPARAVYRRLWPLTGEERNARYDLETEQVLACVLRPDSVAVDVGAHRGSVLATMVRLAPQARHWAFEPLPAYAAHLRATFPTVHVHAVALAAEAGTATFQHVVTNPAYSGLRVRSYPQAERLEPLTVPTARLDDVLPPHTPVRAIKIDVEGGELGVLRGAVWTLTRRRPVVIFEHGRGAADHYGTRPEAIYDLLTSCGLRVTLMAAWLRGRPALTRAAFVSQFARGTNFYFMAYSASEGVTR